MTRRRLAVATLLAIALLLRDGRDARSHARPQDLAGDCEGLQLSEFLPKPGMVDWDGDGVAGSDDEWIELHNAGDTPCDLLNWALDDAEYDTSSPRFVITQTTLLAPGGYMVFFRCQTGITLHNDSDSVRLFSPDAERPYEEFRYRDGVDEDRSFCRPSRLPTWEWPCLPTPGRANDASFRCYLPLVSRGE